MEKFIKIKSNVKKLQKIYQILNFGKKLADLTYIQERKVLMDEKENEIIEKDSDDDGDFEQWKEERKNYCKELAIYNAEKKERENKDEECELSYYDQQKLEVENMNKMLINDPEFQKNKWIYENREKYQKLYTEGKMTKSMDTLYEEYLTNNNNED